MAITLRSRDMRELVEEYMFEHAFRVIISSNLTPVWADKALSKAPLFAIEDHKANDVPTISLTDIMSLMESGQPPRYDPMTHPLYNSIALRMYDVYTYPDVYDGAEITWLQTLLDDMWQLSNDTACNRRAWCWPPPPSPFDQDLTLVRKMIEKRDMPAEWERKLPEAECTPLIGDTPCSQAWIDKLDDNLRPFTWTDFKAFREIWNGYSIITYDEYNYETQKHEDIVIDVETWEGFWKYFDDKACSDWCKMDELGECYGGPWKDDPDNAYTRCKEMNGRALFALPYPKRAVLQTAVVYGCNNRAECVPYSKILCEWTHRMMARLEGRVLPVSWYTRQQAKLAWLHTEIVDKVTTLFT